MATNGPFGARRKHMDGARDDFLAGACFAGNQHRRGRRCGHLHLPHHVLHSAGRADESAEFPRAAKLAG